MPPALETSAQAATESIAYLWASRAAAERVYDSAWKAFVQEKYGTEPRVTFFDTPVLVDNVSGEIVQAT